MLRARSIRETVTDGINSEADLLGSLFTAIRVEFSTIPPYLCAEWSINVDPGNVADMIHRVVMQEMLHFGLACNMFTAAGGSLTGLIANEDFIPKYGQEGLPGGVHPGLIVSLLPLGTEALQTFMAIEYPDVQPVVLEPAVPPAPTPPDPPTIGQFYQTIAAGFQTVFPSGTLKNNPSLNQVTSRVKYGPDTADYDLVFAINTVTDALNAIQEITEQGEGTSASPEEGTFDPTNLAHYYEFAQIYYGYAVNPVGDGFQYTGAQITMPTVFPFSPIAGDQTTFISDFTLLLTQLEACWTSGAGIGAAVGTMGDLETDGTNLIMAGVTPQFTFQPA